MNDSITYLPDRRFQAIYRLLKTSPSWDFQGDLLFGEPITESQINFVATKTGILPE